jgi:hypothetical protein
VPAYFHSVVSILNIVSCFHILHDSHIQHCHQHDYT